MNRYRNSTRTRHGEGTYWSLRGEGPRKTHDVGGGAEVSYVEGSYTTRCLLLGEKSPGTRGLSEASIIYARLCRVMREYVRTKYC